MDIDLILHRHPGGDTKLVGIGNHDYEDGLPDEELDSSQVSAYKRQTSTTLNNYDAGISTKLCTCLIQLISILF